MRYGRGNGGNGGNGESPLPIVCLYSINDKCHFYNVNVDCNKCRADNDY
jgi:hypothetical protein